jgi:hypothetical protein
MYRFNFAGPIDNSYYTYVIKQLRTAYRVDADTCSYIAVGLYALRDNITDKKNFRAKVLDPSWRVLVRINVSGGLGAIARRKYRVTDSRVERYDWRGKLWKVIVWIVKKVVPVVRKIVAITRFGWQAYNYLDTPAITNY